MKISSGAGGGEFSGSIGSITAAKSRYGTIFRTKVRPKDRATRRQRASRAMFTSTLNIWTETLTNANRETWNNWADQTTVDGKLLTGQLAFVRSNIPRISNGLPLVSEAPTKFNNGIPVSRVRGLAAGTDDSIRINTALQSLASVFDFGSDTDDAGDILVFFSRPLSETKVFFKGPFQFSFTAPVPSGSTFLNAFAPFTFFQNENGVLVVSQTRAIRVQMLYDDGRLSEAYSMVGPVLE